MAFYISTGLENQSYNAVRGAVSKAASLNGGYIAIYSGTQPASANAAATGTLLMIITNNSGTFSPGVYQTSDADGICQSQTPVAAGNLTINGATSGILGLGYYVTITGGSNESNKIFRVTGTGNDDEAIVEYIQGPNATTISLANTFKTVTEVYCSAATAGAITVGYGITNGLFLALAADGAITKQSSQIWSGVGIATGTAGWFRFYGGATDAGGVSTTLPRLDGRIATSGAELNLSNTSIVVGAAQTITSFSLT